MYRGKDAHPFLCGGPRQAAIKRRNEGWGGGGGGGVVGKGCKKGSWSTMWEATGLKNTTTREFSTPLAMYTV